MRSWSDRKTTPAPAWEHRELYLDDGSWLTWQQETFVRGRRPRVREGYLGGRRLDQGELLETLATRRPPRMAS